MTDMCSIKEVIQCVTLGIPKGMKKCNSTSIAFCFDFLKGSQKWNIHS